MGRIKTNEDILYYTGWALLAMAGLLVFTLKVFDIHLPGCLFHALTGFYCPGCGGTRAVRYLLSGQLLKSLYCHPAVLPGALLYLLFMGSHTLSRLCKNGKIRGMKFRFFYLYLLGGLVLLSVIMKNTCWPI